ncbi:MAG: zf-TFIIB domain-containing protein [Alcanivoracaceae bacterium]|nr:zf-TFIIB domain-containing protein [Alcanivoracaceae bacterium]
MKCPVDNTPLAQQEYERAVMIDKCPTCDGMWLDQWELKAIQANKGKNYDAELKKLPNLVHKSYLQALEKDRPLLNCPKCTENGTSVKMDRREHGYCSQIMVDVCHDCQGIWLDKGEVQALEVFFERSHLDDKEIKTGFFHSLWFMLNK